MIASKNWVSQNGLGRNYGSLVKGSVRSRGVEIVKVYTRTRKSLKRRETKEDQRELKMALMRVCEDCRTTSTPLWRRGPSGRRTLCNACGIRYRKKRLLLLNCDPSNERPSSSSSSSSREGLSYEELKQRQKEKQMKMLLLLGRNKNNNNEMMMKKMKNHDPIGTKAAADSAAAVGGGRREAEEAALLLLSLSSGILLH